jgi:hypothetical protein
MDVLHTDITGTFESEGLQVEDNVVTLLDDAPRVPEGGCLKGEDRASGGLIGMIRECERQTGHPTKTAWSDR